MKITDVRLTLFSWESIPSTIYGHHTVRPTGKSDLGLLAVVTDHGITGHAFLGTSSNPASLDGPGLVRFLKPILMGQDPLDRERLNRLLWARVRAATVRSIGACDVALWDIAGKASPARPQGCDPPAPRYNARQYRRLRELRDPRDAGRICRTGEALPIDRMARLQNPSPAIVA